MQLQHQFQGHLLGSACKMPPLAHPTSPVAYNNSGSPAGSQGQECEFELPATVHPLTETACDACHELLARAQRLSFSIDEDERKLCERLELIRSRYTSKRDAWRAELRVRLHWHDPAQFMARPSTVYGMIQHSSLA